MIPLLYPERETVETFAQPGEASAFSERVKSTIGTVAEIGAYGIGGYLGKEILSNPEAYRNLFGAAERQTRLVDSMFGEEQAREEAYERRIKAVRDATGIELENPERGGYRLTERELRRLTIDGPIDPAVHRRQRFEGELAAAREKHPDQAEALTFGSIDEEASAIARGAEEEYTRARAAPDLSTPASLVTEFAGAFWAHRRDPLFVGSLFAGPTGAAGRTVAARIVSAGVRQGLYNAGLTALEQPAVQAWRQELGLRSGLMPAVENVGLAFLFGAIPGAALRAGHEALAPAARASVERVLAGAPEPGDIDAAAKAVGESLAPFEAAAARMGEEMDATARLTSPATARGVSRESSDELLAAAMRQADDPVGSPSPAAVEAVKTIRGYLDSRGLGARFHGSTSEVSGFDEGFYGSSVNYYGAQGFYTTEALDVAHGYAYRKGAKAPTIYEVRETKSTNIFDMEAPITPEVRARLEELSNEQYGSTGELAGGALDENPRNLREFFDNVREQAASDRVPADEVQEGVFHPIMDFLEGKGFHGMSHRGGILTKTPEHTVTIYFKPRETLQLRQMSPEELAGLRPGARPALDEIASRIAAAQPESLREAQMAASEALEDIGNRESMARTTDELARDRLPEPEPFPEGVKPPPARSKDPLDKIPLVRDDGTPTLVSARQAAKAGEREAQFAELIRACK